MSTQHLVFDADDLRIKADEKYPGGVVEGHASVFGNVDLQSEVVKPGAFRKTITDFNQSKGRKLIYFMDSHKVFEGTSAVVGKVIELEETGRGLRFVAALSQVARAQEIRQKLKEGILKKLSIGYNVVKEQLNRETRIRELLELKLHEISVVVFPANPEAAVSAVKQQVNDVMAAFEEANEIMRPFLKNKMTTATAPRAVTAVYVESASALTILREANARMRSALNKVESLEERAARVNRATGASR